MLNLASNQPMLLPIKSLIQPGVYQTTNACALTSMNRRFLHIVIIYLYNKKLVDHSGELTPTNL